MSADTDAIEGNVFINESILIYELDEIKKKPGHKFMSGNYIVSGIFRARFEIVGRESYISKLTIQAKKSLKMFLHILKYELKNGLGTKDLIIFLHHLLSRAYVFFHSEYQEILLYIGIKGFIVAVTKNNASGYVQ